MTGLTTEPQKAEAGPGDEVKMSKETQLKVEALRWQLCDFCLCSGFISEQGQSAAPLILPVQGGARGAAGQSPAGP